MLVLTANNEAKNTDNFELNKEVHCSVLSFRDYKNPDFFFEAAHELEEFSSASITLRIGDYTVVMPFFWSILCTDYEYVQSIPLYEVSGRDFTIFCLNPIDGYMPQFLPLRLGTIYPNTTWTSPLVGDKDMLVVPLGEIFRPDPDAIKRGPICAIFSSSKIEINKPIADIWS